MIRSIMLALCLTVGLSAADFADISHADLTSAITAKTVTVIDVNGTASYDKSHIDTAVNYETIKADLAAALPADKNALIVAYCGGPKCGAWQQAAKAAAELGYTNVKHYSAGISGWDAAKAK